MKGLRKSVRKFKQFNRRSPQHLRKIDVDLSVPLVRLGEVPEVTYISDKEGKRQAYRHTTTTPRPVLYAHPRGKFYILLGGNMKIEDWLYD